MASFRYPFTNPVRLIECPGITPVAAHDPDHAGPFPHLNRSHHHPPFGSFSPHFCPMPAKKSKPKPSRGPTADGKRDILPLNQGLYGRMGARVPSKLFRNILDRIQLYLRGKFPAETVHTEILKMIDEFFLFQGVGFHAEKVGFAGAVGGPEAGDGPISYFSEIRRHFVLEVVPGPDRDTHGLVAMIDEVINVPEKVLSFPEMPGHAGSEGLFCGPGVEIVSRGKGDLAEAPDGDSRPAGKTQDQDVASPVFVFPDKDVPGNFHVTHAGGEG